MTTRTVAGSGVQSWTEDAKNFCLRPGQGCLKVLNTALDAGLIRRFHELNPTAPIVYRLVAGDDMAGLPARTERAVRDAAPLQVVCRDQLYVEVPVNEAYQAGDDLSRLSDATVNAVATLKAVGLRPVVGNFSVGNPQLATAMAAGKPLLQAARHPRTLAVPAVKRPLALAPTPLRSTAARSLDPKAGAWARFAPAIAAAVAAGGLLGLHEYSAPGAAWWDGWLNGRYERALDELAALGLFPEIGVGEHFVDGGVLDGNLRGWRAFNLTDDQGAALLDDSLNRYARDPRVRYVALFEGGPYDDWRRRGFEYDTSEPIRRAVERQWTVLERPTPPPPAPPSPPPKPPEAPMADVVLSVQERHSHAVDGNWGEGEAFGPCVGALLHSTASGVDHELEAEYISTVNWFQNPVAEVSAQRIVGAGKFSEVNTSVHDGEVAYHGRDPHNHRRRGLEFAHPDTPAWNARPYPDWQYAAGAELLARWKLADEQAGHVWPLKLLTRAELAKDPNAPGVAYHRDTPQGIADSRRDPTGPFDGARLIREAQAWYTRLKGGTPVPTPPPVHVDPVPPQPGHWPNGRVIATTAEYDLHVWGPAKDAVNALLNGGNGTLGDDQDARDIAAIVARNEQRHGVRR